MPIYEYVCNSCGHEKEVLQSLNDEKLTDCPACGKPEFIRKISAPGFRLKGSGWYETDFKTGKKKNIASETDSKAAAKPDSGGSAATNTANKSTANTDKKPAGKAENK
jgi:putative FmdB family regulatory protein